MRWVWLVFVVLIACSREIPPVEQPFETPQLPEPVTPPQPPAPATEPIAPPVESVIVEPAPAVPVPVQSAKPEVGPAPSALGTRTMKAGTFEGKHVSGSARLIKKTDGTRVLSLDGLYVEPAANLHVYLVENEPKNGIDLGTLVSKKGSYQYAVPSDLNSALITQAVIYNPDKDLVWGSATLT
ncbi:hypothetical protein HY490_02830 [Candidatus Woesearchaeota archaeon]|nr:hypothetical protein [Candidatus Woesearchaeota archaeon]